MEATNEMKEQKKRKLRGKRAVLWSLLVVIGMLWLYPVGADAAAKLAKPPVPAVYNPGEGSVYVELAAKDVANADGFEVYVSDRKDGEYEAVSSWSTYDWEVAGDTCTCQIYAERYAPGGYYVKLRTYRYNKKGKRKYSPYSDTASFTVTWSLKAVPGGDDRIRLIAGPAEGPLGSPVEGRSPREYEICRASSKDGDYAVVATYDRYDYPGDGDNVYVDGEAALGEIYYYKVRALFYDEDEYDNYQYYDGDWDDWEASPRDQVPAGGTLQTDVNGQQAGGTPQTDVNGQSSDVSSGTDANGQQPKPQPDYVLETNVAEGHSGPLSTKSLKSKALKGNQLKLSWKSVEEAEGYYLYELSGVMGTRKKITKVSGATTSYTWKKRKHAEKYRVVVVPYLTVRGKEVQGADSEVFSAVMNYYTSPYDDKLTRFFGKNASKKFQVYQERKSEGKAYYKTPAKAESQMKTIYIKVWDFARGKSGKKITRTFPLRVHKKVAPSLKKAFEEIYKGKEKFPIHDIGGYSYRWGQHGVGLAMDINVNENAHFTNGVADVGSYYRPGKDPYSIPRDGELARILGKYGFLQLEGDYMHFSYFGT